LRRPCHWRRRQKSHAAKKRRDADDGGLVVGGWCRHSRANGKAGHSLARGQDGAREDPA
jgi:hypothetical protein